MRPFPLGEDIDALRDAVRRTADDPEFQTVLSELVESIKARLPKDLHGDFAESDMLKTLLADARALVAGELT